MGSRHRANSEARRRNELCKATGALSLSDAAFQTKIQAQAKRVGDAFKRLADVDDAAAPLSYAGLVPSGWSFLIPYPIWTFQFVPGGAPSFQRWIYLRRLRELQPHLVDSLRAIAASTSSPPTFDEAQDLVEALGAVEDLRAISTQAIAQDENALYGIIRAAYHLPPPVVLTDVPKDAYAVDDGGVVASLLTLRDLVVEAKDAREKADGPRRRRRRALQDAGRSVRRGDGLPDLAHPRARAPRWPEAHRGRAADDGLGPPRGAPRGVDDAARLERRRRRLARGPARTAHRREVPGGEGRRPARRERGPRRAAGGLSEAGLVVDGVLSAWQDYGRYQQDRDLQAVSRYFRDGLVDVDPSLLPAVADALGALSSVASLRALGGLARLLDAGALGIAAYDVSAVLGPLLQNAVAAGE